MADFLNSLFGGQKTTASPVPAGDDADFADFAGAPDPSPASISGAIPSAAGAASASATGGAVPFTKWYAFWDRVSYRDFYQEMYVAPFIILILVIHFWGSGANRRKAKKWAKTYTPVLQKEFALVGFSGRATPSLGAVEGDGLAKAMASSELIVSDDVLKEKGITEFVTYASGRQNVAFVDIKLDLIKRHNPFVYGAEFLGSFLFESITTPAERMEVTLYPFDGREAQLVPVPGGTKGQEDLEKKSKGLHSTYDGFVFAIVNKDGMRQLRDDRYDVSLTATKDHPKLPAWATVMSESAEITETLLTPELLKAVADVGDDFEYLIVSDQPVDKPLKLDDTVPKKRLILSVKLSSAIVSTASPIFSAFLRLPDVLVSSAHFRPEVIRKLRTTRDDQQRQLRKADELDKAEERQRQRDKEKKEKRDRELKGMSAEEQRRYLDREREKEQRKGMKRMTQRA